MLHSFLNIFKQASGMYQNHVNPLSCLIFKSRQSCQCSLRSWYASQI